MTPTTNRSRYTDFVYDKVVLIHKRRRVHNKLGFVDPGYLSTAISEDLDTLVRIGREK